MNAPIKLSLAISLALSGTHVWALGLGTIQVKSGLNQPLLAEIPITISSPGEAADLQVVLATDEDFQRVGLARLRLGAELKFAVVTRSHGDTVIQITSTESIREPYLDFLLQANWAKGKLLREYTVLLDPPITASTSHPVIATETRSIPEYAKTPSTLAHDPSTVAANSQKSNSSALTPVAKMPTATSAISVGGKEFGPVRSGSTLRQVARTVRGDNSIDLNRLMMALYNANPQAFYRPNINALKTGVVLRIPSADEIQAIGSLREAAAQVNSQTQDWMSRKPIMVAGSQLDSANKSNKAHAKTEVVEKENAGQHLALVPPSTGTHDQPGATGHGKTDANNAGTAELARVQENLIAREHETAELKSRLQDLEDIKSKNDRLLDLKNTEIAELQRKLKETQEATAQKATNATESMLTDLKPAVAISGITEAEKAKAAVADSRVVSVTTKPETSSEKTTPTSTVLATSSTVHSMPPSDSAIAPNSSELPRAVPPVSTTSVAVATTPSVKPALAATKLLSAEDPWYKNALFLGGASAVLLVFGLIAALRSRKAEKPIRPMRDATTFANENTHLQNSPDEEERILREALARHPADMDRHLELLSLYYAHRDVAKFESAAQAMHARITDSSQLEWQQVRIMGAELAPTNPLFAKADEASYTSAFVDTGHGHEHTHDHHLRKDEHSLPAVKSNHDLYDIKSSSPLHQYEFDTSTAIQRLNQNESAHSHGTTFNTELLIGEKTDAALPLPTMESITTKLDLARAYLDMGDSDGAQEMLEEVLADGNEAQKQQARKLLEEIE